MSLEDCIMWQPRLFWSEKKASMRHLCNARNRCCVLLVPQRLDGVELRCLAGRIKAEKDAYGPRKGQG